MKKIYLVFLVTLFAGNLFAQRDNKSGVITASDFHITKPLTELVKEFPVDENKVYEKEESEDREHRRPQKFRFSVKDSYEYGNDSTVIQHKMGNVQGKAPITSWSGQNATGFRPMDPTGGAGPNHYVQMINSTTFKVYNKTSGANMLTASLGSLWSPATPNDGDPIVLYDKAADRWFLAQFGQTGNKMFIAISTTGDPTGSYYTYTFTSPEFPDYLKFSVWSDGYYMTSNQTQKVFSFERAAMLAGNAGARAIYTGFSPPEGSGFFVPLPGDASDGVLPPAGTPCPIFSYSDNGWGAGYSDAVNIYQMSVNWVPATPTASITLAANLATTGFDASYNASWNDVSQPNTTQKLDGIGGVCMYRSQWKSWNGYNTVVLNWGVKISTTQRSIKWCELRQDQSTHTWSIYQEGIYTPDAATRWMGSIAMDNNGSIGLAYMKSDATSIYPGLYYVGRRTCDPLGTLPITETQVIAGSGSQTTTNRVGDYAHLTLDPDGITFWHTSEYFGGTNTPRTQIFSFQIPVCGNTAAVSIVQTSGTNPQCQGASATFTATPVNGGTTPTYQWQVNGSNVGSNSPTYTTSSLTNGQVITCIMTSNLVGVTGNPATSNAITMTVNPTVTPSISIAITSGTNPSCTGTSVTFTATPVNGGTPSYQWKVNGTNVGTNNSVYTTTTLTNGQVVTCILTANGNCASPTTATSNGITMSITSGGTPSVSIAQTAGTNPQCSGASATFNATFSNGNFPIYQWKVNGVNVGTNNPSFTTSTLTNGQNVTCDVSAYSTCSQDVVNTLGTGISSNGSTSNTGVAYPTFYGNGRQQYLIRASELTAIGFSAGNIRSMGFNVANTTGNPATLNGYTIKIAQTSATVMTTTFLNPTFTTVYGPVNYTPVLNSLNTHVFTTPFTWDGTSNVVIDICFSNQVTGTSAYPNYRTTASFTASTYYQANGVSGAGACTVTTGSTTTRRPNMTFTINPGSILNASSNIISMGVNSSVTASVSIAITSGTNPQCSGTATTFTATPVNGGSTPSYQWKIGNTNVGSNSPTFSTSTLNNSDVITCVLTSNAACAIGNPATSNAISMTVNPNVSTSVNITANPGNTICDGTNVTFLATPVNGGSTPSYQWKIGITNVGTNSPTYSNASLANGNSIRCVMTSNATCVTGSPAVSNAIAMIVNPNLATNVHITANPGNTICDGTNVNFTATPVNGGSTPTYQWKIGTTNVGTNSPTYSNASLANGNNVSCVMTSNATCATGNPDTSNAIAMTVNPNLAASVSISANPGNIICDGTNVTFTATPTNGGSTPIYQWKIGTINVGTNSLTYSNASLTNGNNVSCVMTSNATCATGSPATSNALTMTVNPNLATSVSISANPGNTICDGTNVTFTASPVNGGATPNYQWKIGTTNVGTNDPTYSSGTLSDGDTISCEIISNAICATGSPATSNAIAMTVNPNLIASVSISANPGNTICDGTNVAFTATPTNGGSTPTYQWKIGTTNVGTNSMTYSSSSLSDGDTFSCEIISNAICATGNPATSNLITMTVNPNLVASVIISANPGNTICDGTNVTFTATPTNEGTTPTYQWKNGAINVGNDDPVYSSNAFSDGDIISCEMTSNALCVTGNPAASNPIALNVIPLPSISGFVPSSGIFGSSITISGSNFNGIVSININGTPVNSYTVDNPSQITMTIPNGASSGTISVVTNCGIVNSSTSLTISSSTVELNLKFFIQGFYLSGGFMTEIISAGITDTFTLELANTAIPHTIDYIQTGLVSTAGLSTFNLPASVQGKSYFILIKHRNAIETWSSIPVDFFSNTVSYDFTTSDLKAYGNNEVALGDGNFALWSGDISDPSLGVGHQDGVIESQDYSDMENAVTITLIGYVVQDLTGDDVVESSDYGLMENNLFYTIVSIHP